MNISRLVSFQYFMIYDGSYNYRNYVEQINEQHFFKPIQQPPVHIDSLSTLELLMK